MAEGISRYTKIKIKKEDMEEIPIETFLMKKKKRKKSMDKTVIEIPLKKKKKKGVERSKLL